MWRVRGPVKVYGYLLIGTLTAYALVRYSPMPITFRTEKPSTLPSASTFSMP
jgi:hypothetical protein